MPFVKRRKSVHAESNDKQEGVRMTVDDQNIEAPDSLDSDAKNATPQEKKKPAESKEHNIGRIGAVTRSRVVKKPKRDLSPPQSPVKKPTKKDSSDKPATGTPETKVKRNWELWSSEDKNAFFEGLFEHGKDFDAIQNIIAARCKKRGVAPNLIKNKDQVRHFYYRTWHKISKFVNMGTDTKKETQELYGLINYGILWKKCKTVLTEKNGIKLDELVHTGSTSLKIKGKNVRIKTPVCNALKKLNNIDDIKEGSTNTQKVPDKIQVEFCPRSNTAWSRVQELSQNPRLKMTVKSDKRLCSVVKFLDRKWKPVHIKMREAKGGETTGTCHHVFTVFPNRRCDVAPISMKAIKEPRIQLAFNNFKETLLNKTPPSMKGKKVETKNPAGDSTGEVQLSGSGDSPVKGEPTPLQAVPSLLSMSVMMEGENAMFPDQPISSPTVKAISDMVSEPPSVSTNESHVTELSATCLSVMEGCDKAMVKSPLSKPSLVDNLGEPAVAIETDAKNPEVVGKDVMVEEEAVVEDEEKQEERIQSLMDRGWTCDSEDSITFAELYLMLGKDGRLRMEYDWCSLDEELSQLTNMVLRLIHLAASEFTDFAHKPSTGPNSPCQSCGTTRGKPGGGRGRAARGGRNPLSSRTAIDGAVDVGTQTSQSMLKKLDVPQAKDPVFRVPVAGPAYFQKNLRPGNQTIINPVEFLSQQTKGRKIKTGNRRPMMMQRTLLPKGPPRHALAFVPMSTPPTAAPRPSGTINVQPHIIESAVPRIIVPSATLSSAPISNEEVGDHLQISTNSIASGVVSVEAKPAMLDPISGATSTSPVTIITMTTSGDVLSALPTTAVSCQSSVSPPRLSSLLDMSLSNLPVDPDNADNFIDGLSLGSSSNFASILASSKPQACSSTLNTPVKNGGHMNGNSSPAGSPKSPWLNGEESGDVSLLTLLTESTPVKRTTDPATSIMVPGLFESSRDSLMLDVSFQSNFSSMLTESSIDYVSKFAELADIITQGDENRFLVKQESAVVSSSSASLSLLPASSSSSLSTSSSTSALSTPTVVCNTVPCPELSTPVSKRRKLFDEESLPSSVNSQLSEMISIAAVPQSSTGNGC